LDGYDEEKIKLTPILSLRDMVKAVMTLAVPGILLYMENHRCIAVVVKNPRSRMIGMEPVYLEQY
jgi:hypothetical protein